MDSSMLMSMILWTFETQGSFGGYTMQSVTKLED